MSIMNLMIIYIESKKEGAKFSQLNFDPNSNGKTISQSLNAFGELRDMQLGDNNLYGER